MKHYTRVGRSSGRIDTFSLIDKAGDPVEAFDFYVDGLVQQGQSASTVENYSNHVAVFLDYLTEAKVFGFPCSELEILKAIKGYLPARIAGANANGDYDVISRKILRQKKLSKSSAKAHAAAINGFLFESDQYSLHIQQIEALENGAAGKTPDQLFREGTRKRSGPEITKIYQSSMLINVMHHHPTLTAEKSLRVRGKDSTSFEDKDFPAEYIMPLLDCATSARDEALWALQAGTGVRPAEAVLLGIDQIDFQKRTIVVEDPHNRRFASQMPDRHFKRWKGRAMSDTYFIPLLRDRFFKALERYFRTEYIPRPGDTLVFQCLKGKHKPYVEVSDHSRTQSFMRACIRLQEKIPDSRAFVADLTPYSLRHFYGTYMLNYVPVGPNNFGLKPVEVQKLMGHDVLSSTMRYARQDKLALEAKIILMNAHALGEAPEVDQLVKWMADKYADHADRLNRTVAARMIDP